MGIFGVTINDIDKMKDKHDIDGLLKSLNHKKQEIQGAADAAAVRSASRRERRCRDSSARSS